MGDGHDIVIVEHSEKVVRVDTSAWRVRYEEGAVRIIRRGKCVHVEVTFRLVVGPRGLDDHNPTLDESNCNGSVAQHDG